MAQTIGPYVVGPLLGRGGMARVHRAQHQVTGERVALKVLELSADSSMEVVRRFRREAELLLSLSHLNLVKVLATGEEPTCCWMALDLVEGYSLGRYIEDSGVLPEVLALRIAAHVSRALAYLHEKGVVHRDVKPANILVANTGHVKLADFGVAKSEEFTAITQSDQLLGTLAYMAPEALSGSEVTSAADIFGLGLVLHRMLGGSVPRAAGSDTAADLTRLVDAMTAPAPAARPSASLTLEAVEKALAVRQADSPHVPLDALTLAELRADWDVAASFSTEVAPTEHHRFGKHRLLGAPVAAALLLVLVVGAGAWILRPVGPSVVLLDDFERAAPGWSFVGGQEFPGAQGDLSRDASVSHRGAGSYRLRGNFSRGGNYVGTWRSLANAQGLDFGELRLWVKSQDVSTVGVRFADATGQIHQNNVPLAAGERWQEIVLRPDQLAGLEHWGGANDGRWHPPARAFGLNLPRVDVTAITRAGTLWFDDLVGIPATGPQRP